VNGPAIEPFQEVVLPKDVIMPALGLAQETGRVVQWLKADGDLVATGDLLVEIETDKATLELEAEASGYLKDISVEPDTEVPVGSVIAKIWAEDELIAGAPTEPSSDALIQPESKTRETSVSTSSYSAQQLSALQNPVEADGPGPSNARLPSSPKARRLAAEQGIDLGRLRSASGRPVVASDLHAQSLQSAVDEKPAMNRTWRIMAERLTAAWTSIPHFYLTREVAATRAVALKKSAQGGPECKVTISDILVQAVANCLRDHPRLRTLWQDGGPQSPGDINIGLAVALEDGLVVPVIHHADRLSLLEIAKARTEIVQRAQSGKSRPDDLAGGTFTISNLGMYGVDSFQAIVNPPQAAILAVGRIAERVVPADSTFAIRPMMTLTLSCDHRLVDGARAARFLLDLANALERVS
jgi:pyruvate dehydrogenase E2 component (dihydrolipoamide acetyltransferase)